MLRRPIRLLMLSLLSTAGLGAPRAEATNILFLTASDDIFCEDLGGLGTSCSKTINLSDVDVTDSGNNINFELFVDHTQGTWGVDLFVSDGTNSDTQPFPSIAADGKYYVAFTDFTGAIDFTSINTLELTFANSSSAGDRLDVTAFGTVPEPGTAGMLLLGMLGLAFSARRRPA